MQAKQAQKLEDWASVPLDAEGKEIQDDMTRKFQVCLLRNDQHVGYKLIDFFQVAASPSHENDACSVY